MEKVWEEDLPYSSPIFLWAPHIGRKIAAGVLSLFHPSFCIPFFFHSLLSLYVQSVMRGLCVCNVQLLQATRQAH